MKFDRRHFLSGATGLVALPLLPSRLLTPAQAELSRFLFHADMEVAHFSEYERSGGPSINAMHASGNSPVISTDRARSGRQSLKVYLNRHESPNAMRTEVSTVKERLEYFRTHWIGFSMYIPSDWAISNTWEVCWQLHSHPLDWNNYHAISPILAIRIEADTDQWLLRQVYVESPKDPMDSSNRRTAFAELVGSILSQRGTWVDWVIEYRPDWRSRRNGGTGITRIWMNNHQVIDYRGPNCINETYTPYIKFGAYKSAWRDRNRNDPVIERLYYFDEFRVSGPDRGSYDLVAPGDEAAGLRPLPPRIVQAG